MPPGLTRWRAKRAFSAASASNGHDRDCFGAERLAMTVGWRESALIRVRVIRVRVAQRAALCNPCYSLPRAGQQDVDGRAKPDHDGRGGMARPRRGGFKTRPYDVDAKTFVSSCLCGE